MLWSYFWAGLFQKGPTRLCTWRTRWVHAWYGSLQNTSFSSFQFTVACRTLSLKLMESRLNGSARLMLVSDLDYTMVDHDDPQNASLLRFNALWEAYYRHDSLLVFSTGRSPLTYKPLRIEKPLLTPDITIMSVGTEIFYGELPDDGWQQYLNHNWNRNIVVEETNKFPQLTPQAEAEQRPHKVSFWVDKVEATEVMNALSQRLATRGLDVKIIYSSGIALDVLPKGAGKGQALAYLLNKFKIDDKLPCNTLVCGDSGNDVELFSLPEVYGVMVGNAQEELLHWYAQNAKSNSRILHATERCAAGIIQAIGNFHLGQYVSPRDIRDFQKCNINVFSPAYEVVKFYWFYEKWRCAEVEKSDQYMQNLRSVFHSLGVFVRPSGVELPLQQCLDAMGRLYGDKKGNQFWTWVDQLSSAQIGSDTWLVKFYKWELNGNERQCTLTTVLIKSQVEVPDTFTWLHIHQTWLDGFGIADAESWTPLWFNHVSSKVPVGSEMHASGRHAVTGHNMNHGIWWAESPVFLLYNVTRRSLLHH